VRATVQPGYAPRHRPLSSSASRPGFIAALACLGLALAGRRDGPPAADGPDRAATVSTRLATLSRRGDPKRSDTWYFFVYGFDRYDGRTPLARAGDGLDPVAVSAPITGLTPATILSRAPDRLSTITAIARGDDVPFTTVVPVAPPLAPGAHALDAGSAVPPRRVLGQSVNADVRSGTVTVKVHRRPSTWRSPTSLAAGWARSSTRATAA